MMTSSSTRNAKATLMSMLSLLFLSSSHAFTIKTPTVISRNRVIVGATLEGREIIGEIEPVNNFVLVETAGIMDQTDSGILLSKTAKVKKTEGKVISVGPGRTHPDSGKYFPMPVSTGDGVIYGKFDGTELDYNGKPHTLIRDVDIMVRYTDGDKLTLENAEMVFDNVLVHIVEEESTSGGLLIASTANKEDRGRQCTGTVVKVGPGKMVADGSILDMNVEVGDKVKFRDFAGNEVTIGGEEYSVVAMTDILAKF
uniref:20 kDa chaperonin, chloroplastic n=1 Tax=Ditylum brightwellii TaxID=49249 RepID=A0A6S8Y9J4_9STRA|mmetsp:Transcript_37870/g.56686  ORF Transcript_37870/g.56686 Transcript_37870/m.56686 type:complete len:255 (+) Transcript_37870:216-980(+)